MDKNYIAVTIKENGKHYAYVVIVSSNDNVLSKLEIKGIIHANIYKTKKRASEVVNTWNNGYKNNGTYMFDKLYF